MSQKAKYTLDEGGGLKIVVFDQYGDLDYDSFYILDPSESESEAWEVWLAEWNDSDMKQADLIRKQIEIHSEWVTKTEHVHLVLQSLQFGYEVGHHDGQTRMQALNRFSFAALTGEVDITELNEAAHQADFAISEDGRNYSKQDATCSTVFENVRDLVVNLAPKCICDDCIAEKLELTARQHANLKTRELSQNPEYLRTKRECSACGGEKLSISYQLQSK